MGASRSSRAAQKAKTRTALVEAARALLEAGHQPSLQDIADHAGISRATSYRYYSDLTVLYQEAALSGVVSGVEALKAEIALARPEAWDERIELLVVRIVDMILAHEVLFRSYLHTHIIGEESKVRGKRRRDWLHEAVAPDLAFLPAELAERVLHSLSLLTGVETVIVARDVCDLDDSGIRDLCRWTTRAILKAALEDAGLNAGEHANPHTP